MEIIWTRLAKATYLEVMEGLKLNWTKKEMNNFKNLTNGVLENITNERVIYQNVNEKLGIKKCIIHRNVSLFYREERQNNKVYLITFFNNRMNPKLLSKILKQ